VPPPEAGNRGALLGAIQGGLKLRKAVTVDKSGPLVAGAVKGDPSPPVQKYVPPPSPPPAPAAPMAPERNWNRQSVDWANNMAVDQMNGQKASLLPDEPSVREEPEDSGDEDEAPEDPNGHNLPALSVEPPNGGYTPAEIDTPATAAAAEDATAADPEDPTADYDLTQSVRCRSLYAYEAQRDEDLGFEEHQVIIAHPAKDAGGDWWYGTLLSGAAGTKGTFPKAYVQPIQRESHSMRCHLHTSLTISLRQLRMPRRSTTSQALRPKRQALLSAKSSSSWTRRTRTGGVSTTRTRSSSRRRPTSS
jgi:hypothetical protein